MAPIQEAFKRYIYMRMIIFALVIGISSCGESAKDRKIMEQSKVIAVQAKKLNNLTRLVVNFSSDLPVDSLSTIVDLGRDSVQIVPAKRLFGKAQEK